MELVGGERWSDNEGREEVGESRSGDIIEQNQK